MVEALSATNANGSPLTPRGLKTRSALVAAARLVFERDGFMNARITDISEEAGVAHGTFYSYFDSKEEIFRAVITALQERLIQDRRVEDAERAGPGSVREAALRANRRYLTTWKSHTKLMQLWEEVAILDEEVAEMLRVSRMAFVARAEAAIRTLRDSNQIDPSLNPRVTAFALTGMVSRFAYVWFTESENFDFDEVCDQLTRLWLNALEFRPSPPR